MSLGFCKPWLFIKRQNIQKESNSDFKKKVSYLWDYGDSAANHMDTRRIACNAKVSGNGSSFVKQLRRAFRLR